MSNVPKISLTDNDLLLFKYLFECRFLSREHIQKFIYTGFNPNYVTTRIWKLVRNKYLRKVPIATKETILLPTHKSLYALDTYSDKVKLLTRKNGHELSYFPADAYRWYLNSTVYDKAAPINYKEFAHNNKVNEIRFYLEDRGALYWVSDIIYKNREITTNNPDGYFKVKYLTAFKTFDEKDIPKDALNVTGPMLDDDGKTCFKFDYHKFANVAIEYERSMKRRSRYIGGKNDTGIFRRYAQDDRFNFVIYVTGDKYIYNGLAKIMQPSIAKINDIPHALDKFYLIHERELLNGELSKMINPNSGKLCPIIKYLKGGD